MRPIEQKIKQRMSEAVVRSYFKPWHKRTWAKVLFFFLAIIFILVVYFIYLTASSFIHLRKGDIYNQQIGAWITPVQFENNQKALADLLSDDDPWLGAEKPLIFVVAYESLACPFCKADQAEIKKMLGQFGTFVRFVTKDFPTEGLHPNVFEAHLAAGCANEQGKYWEFRDKAYANQGNFSRDNFKTWARELGLDSAKFNKCLDEDKYNQEIRQDYAEGVQAGVIGTPSYVINGNIIPGAIGFDMWKEIVAYILNENYK